MNVRRVSAAAVGVTAGLAVLAGVWVATAGRHGDGSDSPAVIRLRDHPAFDTSDYRSSTFSLAVADINRDGLDDILIGAHSDNPFLLTSTGAGLKDESRHLFPEPRNDDRHAYTLADFDNDARLDLIIACGGSGGVGEGWPNLLFRNVTGRDGLRFEPQPITASLGLPAGRSRSFIPFASADGAAVDLYYTALRRDGFSNLVFRNSGGAGSQPFTADPGHFLSRTLNDAGRGALADLDGDRGTDYLVVEGDKLKIYWHRDAGARPAVITSAARMALLADFNNDALLDIFVGRESPGAMADEATFGSDGLLFTIRRAAGSEQRTLSFRSASDTLLFKVRQSQPATGKGLPAREHIFLGQGGAHPRKRNFQVSRQQAQGTPAAFAAPGMYIWYTAPDDTWHLHWAFPERLDLFAGHVRGSGLAEVSRQNFQRGSAPAVSDQIFLNEGGGHFAQLPELQAPHVASTHGATAADFNGDGWLDVLAARHQPGGGNLAPFLLTNTGGTAFTQALLPIREQDRLHSADQVAHGFIDADDLPDAVITNGYGQISGNGEPRVLINATEGAGGSLLVSLQGTRSNAFAVGAALSLYGGSRLLGYRVVGLNTNTSQDTLWQHFGLGDLTGPYRLVVDWPDGTSSEHILAEPGRHAVVQPP